MSNAMRNLAASVALMSIIAAAGVACSTDAGDTPTDTQSPSTRAPESSGMISPTPVEKEMTTNSPNSFSPSVKAPTPYSPRPCLPFCD